MEADKTVVPGFLRGYRLWRTDIIAEKIAPEDSVVKRGDDAWSLRRRFQWNVTYRDFYLHAYGIGMSHFWTPGVETAECVLNAATSHHAPSRACRCGLYARYDAFAATPFASTVGGVIDGFGRIVMGTSGFRAEKAVIRALWLGTYIDPAGLQQIADLYQVPLFRTADEAVYHFPPSDISELIEEDLYFKNRRLRRMIREEITRYLDPKGPITP